jgi:hypothetical protein
MIKIMYPLYNQTISKILFLLLIFCTISIQESFASHATGADLTYESLGNNQYRITFTFYRDCTGIDAPFNQPLSVTSSCGSLSGIVMDTVPDSIPGPGTEIATACSSVVTACNGGTFPGFQQCIYSTIVTLPGPCFDWQFSTGVSARNPAITTIVTPDNEQLYVEAFLNNTTSENNSPVFTSLPVAFECIGQDNLFNQGVIDAEGDSLVYSFIARERMRIRL